MAPLPSSDAAATDAAASAPEQQSQTPPAQHGPSRWQLALMLLVALGAALWPVAPLAPAPATAAAPTPATALSSARLGEAVADSACDASGGACEVEYPRLAAIKRVGNRTAGRVWSEAELALHSGSDRGRPLLLAIAGEVYDVGPGARHYAPGGGYHGFAGRDNSRGFSGGEDEEEAPSSLLVDLPEDELAGALHWRGFYREHESYRFVGVLEGRYFDGAGQPTAENRQLEELHDSQAHVERVKRQLRERFVGCNSRFEAVNSYFEIWCDNGYHGEGSVPLHFYYRPPSSSGKAGQEEGWCACLTPSVREAAEAESREALSKPGPGTVVFRLVEYPECKGGASQRCRRPKGAKAP